MDVAAPCCNAQTVLACQGVTNAVSGKQESKIKDGQGILMGIAKDLRRGRV